MNKIIENDETSDDENEDFLYRQNLFCGYEERKLNPENTESISENEIENLIDTINLEEWYKIESNLIENLDNKSESNLDNRSESSIQTYK